MRNLSVRAGGQGPTGWNRQTLQHSWGVILARGTLCANSVSDAVSTGSDTTAQRVL